MIAPVAFPPTPYAQGRSILLDLKAVGANSVIAYGSAHAQFPRLAAEGVTIRLLTGHDATKVRPEQLAGVTAVVVGDEPNFRGGPDGGPMPPSAYAHHYRSAVTHLRRLGFEGEIYTAGIGGHSGFLQKWWPRPEIAYANELRKELGHGVPIPANIFWRPVRSVQAAGYRAVVGTGFGRFTWWRDPVSGFMRDILGWRWLLKGATHLDFVGVWCLGTYDKPVPEWGMVRPDGSLTRAGVALRRFLT